jgi:crotonobetainyl-CoA:carnitine CoA-transferase CaiB-like acyl-CoA transferase
MTPSALSGLRVLEIASVVSGPSVGKYLADFGADVIKIEPPGGDGTRSLGWLDPSDGISLFFKLVNRGKRSIMLDLKTAAGSQQARELAGGADVLIENMRPGRLERLGLDPAELIAANPRLVVLRLTGFGQTGPRSQDPGFATTAEAMSGLSSVMGEPDRGPSLPPIALTDEVSGLAGALAVMIALHHVGRGGQGQIIDVSLLESVFQILGPLPAAWAKLGYLQQRLGAGLPYSVPRGTYQARDGRWIAVSTSAESVARRVLEVIGIDEPELRSFEGRYANRDLIEGRLRSWIGSRDAADAISQLCAANAAVAAVLDMAEVANDAHFRERQALVTIDNISMQAPIARMSVTPGRIRHAGVRALAPGSNWLDVEDLDEATSQSNLTSANEFQGVDHE